MAITFSAHRRPGARQAATEAGLRLAELTTQLSHHQTEAAKLLELRRTAEAATEELEHYASRAAERGEAPTAEGWLERGEAKRRADAALREAEKAERQYLQLAEQRPALVEAQKRALRAVILEEGQRLAEQLKHHLRAVERAQAGMDALIRWASYTAHDSRLAVALQSAARPLPQNTAADPAAFTRASDARKADLRAFSAAWASLPDRLASDIGATAPDPEEDQ